MSQAEAAMGPATPPGDSKQNGNVAGDSDKSNIVDLTGESPRQSLREFRTNPPPRKRKRQPAAQPGDAKADEEAEELRRLDRLIRWNVFMYHSADREPEMMSEVYGEDWDPDSSKSQRAHIRIHNKVKSIKSQILSDVEIHVRSLCVASSSLRSTRDSATLGDEFAKSFSPEAFFICWRFMKGHLNITKSSAMGQDFCKSNYVNICIKVKRYIDAKDSDNPPRGTRYRLLEFWHVMPQHESVKGVKKEDFHEEKKETLAQKKARIRVEERVKRIDEILSKWISVGTPPPSVSRSHSG